MMAAQVRPVWDFEDVDDSWALADAGAMAPILAVPTTAGTGSAVGRAGILPNSVTRERKIVFHPRLLTSQIICSLELSLDMPPASAVGTGMDAFAHCFEAFCGPNFRPMSAGIAREVMRLVHENLSRAKCRRAGLGLPGNGFDAGAKISPFSASRLVWRALALPTRIGTCWPRWCCAIRQRAAIRCR